MWTPRDSNGCSAADFFSAKQWSAGARGRSGS